MPELRSLDRLHLERSWTRVLSWVRRRIGDVPDRTQYELFDRLWAESRTLEASHDVEPMFVVQATKGSHQTVRPFIRPHARDLLLYWALVDAAATAIEPALGPPDRLFANRWTDISEDVTPATEPNWSGFSQQIEKKALHRRVRYVLRADVSSFYMAISVDRLMRLLLEVGVSADVTADLEMLLKAWQIQGVRGLPQGLPPSGPLANIYLRFADQHLADTSVDFVRYSDDIAMFFSTFSEARRTLDDLERTLYAEGLTLGGEKTRIMRASTTVDQLQSRSERTHRAMTEFAGDYDWSEDEIEDADRDIARGAFDGALEALDEDRYERNEFIFAFRRLGRFADPHALKELPRVLRQMPGLTGEAMSYVEALAPGDDVMEAIEDAVADDFHRDQEWLHLLRALSSLEGPCSDSTLSMLATVATDHVHPLVRARAMLAWCRQSPSEETSLAENFFLNERHMWKGWAVAGIRDKARRDELYARWRAEGRSIAQLIESLSVHPLDWSST